MDDPYHYYEARAIARDGSPLPDRPGVYMISINNPGELASAFRSLGVGTVPLLQRGGAPVIYVGSTAESLQRRIGYHLHGDSRKSTFRMSLGALLQPTLGLQAEGTPGRTYFCFGDGEAALTHWIKAHSTIAFRPSTDPIELEKCLIGRHEPALNIAHRRQSKSAARLMELRAALGLRRVRRGPPETPQAAPIERRAQMLRRVP